MSQPALVQSTRYQDPDNDKSRESQANIAKGLRKWSRCGAHINLVPVTQPIIGLEEFAVIPRVERDVANDSVRSLAELAGVISVGIPMPVYVWRACGAFAQATVGVSAVSRIVALDARRQCELRQREARHRFRKSAR